MNDSTLESKTVKPIDVEPPIPIKDFVHFLLDVCRQLMECGCSAHRVENLCTKLGASWGFEVESLAFPTGLWIVVRRGDERMMELARIKRWSVDLDLLARLNQLVESIYEHSISMADARGKLIEISKTKKPYSSLITVLAGGGSSFGYMYFYGGSWLECLAVVPAGMFVQLLGKYLMRAEHIRYLSDFVSGVFVAAFACLVKIYVPQVDPARLTVGGLISLVPGLILVNALHEVAQKNLVSGSSRLFEAMIVAVSLTFGALFVFGTFKFFGVM